MSWGYLLSRKISYSWLSTVSRDRKFGTLSIWRRKTEKFKLKATKSGNSKRNLIILSLKTAKLVHHLQQTCIPLSPLTMKTYLSKSNLTTRNSNTKLKSRKFLCNQRKKQSETSMRKCQPSSNLSLSWRLNPKTSTLNCKQSINNFKNVFMISNLNMLKLSIRSRF